MYREYLIIVQPIIGGYVQTPARRAHLSSSLMFVLKHTLNWLSARPTIGRCSQTPVPRR